MDAHAMRLAGMVSADDRLGRQLALPEDEWLVDPDVELGEDKHGRPALTFDEPSVADVARQTPRGRRWVERTSYTSEPIVLDRFAALADASPDRVLAFARKYGRLELCQQHHLPHFHRSTPGHAVICRQLNPEPVALYTHYARVVSATLDLAAAAHRGSVDRRAPWWTEAWDLVGGPEATPSVRTERHVPALLTLRIRWWLMIGDVRADFWWIGDRPEVRLGGRGLWGAIARQLAFAVTRAGRMATCAGCGTPFTPARLQTTRQSWCPQCGKRAADRESKRRQRARLHARGRRRR